VNLCFLHSSLFNTFVCTCWIERDYCWGSRQGSSRDRRESRKKRRRKNSSRKQQNQQKTGWSVDRSGRPTCTACTESRGGRPAGRPQFPDCKCPTLCCFRSTDRSTEVEVGRPVGRPTVGFGRKSAVPEIWVFKAVVNSRV